MRLHEKPTFPSRPDAEIAFGGVSWSPPEYFESRALLRLQLNGCLRNARRPIGTNAAYEMKGFGTTPWQLD